MPELLQANCLNHEKKRTHQGVAIISILFSVALSGVLAMQYMDIGSGWPWVVLSRERIDCFSVHIQVVWWKVRAFEKNVQVLLIFSTAKPRFRLLNEFEALIGSIVSASGC